MGNYKSTQAQLESELKNMFDRLMNKNTIEKTNIMGLVSKFKSLKEENPARYTSIANRASSLNESFKKISQKGRVKPKEWEKLKKIYEDFKEMLEESSIQKVA